MYDPADLMMKDLIDKTELHIIYYVYDTTIDQYTIGGGALCRRNKFYN